MTGRHRPFVWMVALCVLLGTAGAGELQPRDVAIFDSHGQPREAICYGPFRDGQHPGKPQTYPSVAEIREDMHILARHWGLLRIYGSDSFADRICQVIREDGLDLKVMVGAWLSTESKLAEDGSRHDLAEAKKINQQQVDNAIRLANAYPDVVVAVSVGNEALVSWSFHAVQPARLIEYVRQVREQTSAPVTVADDFMFWLTPESHAVAGEIDFIVTHIYAMWHGRRLDEMLAFTQEKYGLVQQQHPDKLIAVGEAGWATDRAETGEQAKRMAGVAGEKQQAQCYRALTQWARQARIPLFYFEAFDEKWKGGPDPREVEKHWGLFRSDRTPKPVMQGEK